MRQFHIIPPVFDERSKILILGSFPSVKSREGQFFYHHPQNRFWRVLSKVLAFPEPVAIDEKKNMLLLNSIALWDMAESCEIERSSDGSIREVVPSDLHIITNAAPISRIFTNGGAAHNLYTRFGRPMTGLDAARLPSTSPANAGYGFDRLVREWSIVAEALGEKK